MGQLVSRPCPWVHHHFFGAEWCNFDLLYRYVRHNHWRSALEDPMFQLSSKSSLARTKRWPLPSASERVPQFEHPRRGCMVVHAANLALVGTRAPFSNTLSSLGFVLDLLYHHFRCSVRFRFFRSRKGCRARSTNTGLPVWVLAIERQCNWTGFFRS
jgi:hypothetical protein